MVRTEHDIVSQVRSAKTDSEAADALIRQYMGFIRSETVKFLPLGDGEVSSYRPGKRP